MKKVSQKIFGVIFFTIFFLVIPFYFINALSSVLSTEENIKSNINILESSPIFTCSDSDGGDNIDVQGEIDAKISFNRSLFKAKDRCVFSKYLLEYYCKNEKSSSLNEVLCVNLYSCDCDNATCKGNALKKNSKCGEPLTDEGKNALFNEIVLENNKKISQVKEVETENNLQNLSSSDDKIVDKKISAIRDVQSVLDSGEINQMSSASQLSNPIENQLNIKNDIKNNILDVSGGTSTSNNINIKEPIFNTKFTQNLSKISGFLGAEFEYELPVDEAELFLQREKSEDLLFVGRLQPSNGKWVVQFDTNNFPNGKYKLFVKTKVKGVTFEKISDELNIANEIKKEPEKIIEKIQEKIKSPPLIDDQKKNELTNVIKQELERVGLQPNKVLEEIKTQKLKETNKKEEQESSKILQENLNIKNLRESKVFKEPLKATELKKLRDKELKEIESKAKELNERELKEKELKEIEKPQKIKETPVPPTSEKEKSQENEKSQAIISPSEVSTLPSSSEEVKDIIPEIPPIQNKIEDIKKAIIDFDNDGMSNEDELRFGTDPFNVDSDNDGYIDSVEVQHNFNPTSSIPEEKMKFESPKESGQVNAEVLAVEKVEIVTTPVQKEKPQEPPKILLKGKGLPNSFVTIFIYSEPIIVTVKTDENGDWSYVLDKNIEDGKHEVYVAITNNTGKIIEKSPALLFIKTAQAVSIVESEKNAFSPQEVSDSISIEPESAIPISPQKALWPFIFFITLTSILLVLIILTIIAKTHAGQPKE